MAKPITASDPKQLFIKVKALYEKFETADTRRVDIIYDAIKAARKKGID